jgi:acetylcholinesterase
MIYAHRITGNCDDEGSLFSLSSLNVSYVRSTCRSSAFAERGGSTTAEVSQYLKSFMLPTAPQNEVDLLLQYYPEDPTVGCPFDTGTGNVLSKHKRIPSLTELS